MGSASAGIGSALPSQVGVTSGWALTTDGTTASWASVGGGSGVDTVGTFSATGITNGASISGTTITLGPADGTKPGLLKALATVGSTPAAAGASLGTDGTLTLQPADGTYGGVVSTGAQTFAGTKTFSAVEATSSVKIAGATFTGSTVTTTTDGNLTVQGVLKAAGDLYGITNLTFNIFGWGADGNVATALDTVNTFTTGKILSIKNATTEKVFVGPNGTIELTTVGAGLILKSPNGDRWKLVVADTTGALSTTAA